MPSHLRLLLLRILHSLRARGWKNALFRVVLALYERLRSLIHQAPPFRKPNADSSLSDPCQQTGLQKDVKIICASTLPFKIVNKFEGDSSPRMLTPDLEAQQMPSVVLPNNSATQ
jgi:hypothetical protein